MSGETGHECLHYDSDEETHSCSCGFIGFKRNQVFDCSLSRSSSEKGDDDQDIDSEELFEINLKEPLDTIREDRESTLFSIDVDIESGKGIVYVAVGDDGESSMDALSWTLKHAVTRYTTVCLLHVFPEIRFIPSPLGKIPRSHVNAVYVNIFLTQQKSQRKLLLQKFVDLCVGSEVNVEMMLIEGDNVAKAIVDLVTNLRIRKLVIGTPKSNLRKSGSTRQNAIADKVLKNAPESCDVKIICQGSDVIPQMIGCTSSRSRDGSSSRVSQGEDESRGFFPLVRCMPKPIWLFRTRFL